jgi:hypothetical protein
MDLSSIAVSNYCAAAVEFHLGVYREPMCGTIEARSLECIPLDSKSFNTPTIHDNAWSPDSAQRKPNLTNLEMIQVLASFPLKTG